MKYLLPFIFAATAAFAAHEPPNTVPGKIYESSPQLITPSAGPRVDHGIDAWIAADFIYWTARMDNLSYAQTGVTKGDVNASKGNTKYPDWRWKPGFKAGLGLGIPHDGWDVFVEYTWLHSRAWNSVNENEKGILATWNISHLLLFSKGVDDIQSAKSNWKLQYNALDLSLGRNYFVSKFLALRPFIGFKGGWINQDYRVKYHVAATDLDSNLRMKNDQSYWGIGLRTGLNTSWHLTQTWSFYGNLALSALWSQFEVNRKDTRIDTLNDGSQDSPPLNTNVTTINTENDFHTIKGLLELGIGMRGEWWFAEDRYHFLVQAGWEQQLWINHNQLIKTSVFQANHGDLTLQGLTIKARFDF